MAARLLLGGTLRQPAFKTAPGRASTQLRTAMARHQHTFRDVSINWKLSDVPTPAKVLGFAGTIPFLAGTYALVKGKVPNEHTALAQIVQLNYSACILSFMGAVHWGLEMAHYGLNSSALAWRRYALSTVPSLVAWVTLCMPYSGAYMGQMVAFNALLYADIKACQRRLVPAWYPGLRIYLTAIVTMCLGTSFCTDAWRGYLARKAAARMQKERQSAEAAAAAAAGSGGTAE